MTRNLRELADKLDEIAYKPTPEEVEADKEEIIIAIPVRLSTLKAISRNGALVEKYSRKMVFVANKELGKAIYFAYCGREDAAFLVDKILKSNDYEKYIVSEVYSKEQINWNEVDVS